VQATQGKARAAVKFPLLGVAVLPELGLTPKSVVPTPIATAQAAYMPAAVGIVRVLRLVALRQERHVTQQRVVAEVGARLASAADEGAVVARACEGAADLVAIAREAPVLVALRTTAGAIEVRASTDPDLVGTTLDWVTVGKTGAERTAFADLDPERAPPQWRSSTLLPLIANSTAVGVLSVDLDDADLAVALRSLAPQIGLALSRVEALERLRAREARFRSLVANASDVIRVLDRDGTVTDESEAVKRVLGFEATSIVGRDMFADIHPDDVPDLRARFERLRDEPSDQLVVTQCRIRHNDGQWRHVEWTMKNLLNDPAVNGVVVNYNDISERVLLEEELRYRALHDSLTGLPNRDLFLDRLNQAMRRQRRTERLLGVLFIDLDGFKPVNDRYGHSAGDHVLQITAKRLRSVSREADSCARFGGDEFGVLLEDLNQPSDARTIAKRIIDLLAQPTTIEGQPIQVTASVGIAYGDGTQPAEQLVQQADQAMYQAKTNGQSQPVTYEPATTSQTTTN
jgi:diguanylate cyclase (GGDEF)-like protein/PAS domain S-box-containing protein